MEALGIAASIIAVIQLAGKLTSLGYGYIGGVKRAPKDVQELLDELSSLVKVLVVLRDYVDKNPQSAAALQTLNGPGGPIHGIGQELGVLQSKLDPTGKDGFKGIMGDLKWPLKEKETMQHISRIDRHKSLFIFALTTDQMALSKAIEGYVQNTNHAVKEIEAQIKYTNNVVDAGFIAQSSWRQQEDNRQVVEKRKKVLHWVYSEDFNIKHAEISKRRQGGTGGWLLRAPEFLEWRKEQPNYRLLWGYGIPGAGKTFLSSSVIDDLEAKAQISNHGVAHIYFDYNERERQKPSHVLSSLVKQLAIRLPHLPTALVNLYDKLEADEKRPTMVELYSVLLAISKYFKQLFFVFDALDECDPQNQRKELLPLFQQLAADRFSVFLTSRPHPEDIQDSLYSVAKIELSAQEEDIVTYVREKINGNPRAKRLIRQGKCEDRIIRELVACAEGMFLLVHFHIDHLCQQATAKQILAALDKLKNSWSTGGRSLDPTYDRAMNNIRTQHRSLTALALSILSWLVKAKRTLKVEELRVAIAVEPEIYELNELDLSDRTTLIDVCASLVTIDEHSDTIRLAHYTVQEYLIANSVIPEDADFQLAMACTTYLSFDMLAQQGPCTSFILYQNRLESLPFLDYAARHLSVHLKACNENLSTEIFCRLLENPGSISSYLQVLYTGEVATCLNWYPKERRPLHIASDIGHLAAVSRLLEQGAEISAPAEYGMTSLHLAASGGHDAIVKLLLEKGGDILALDDHGQTPLHSAASEGKLAVAQLLLDKGANPSALDKYCETPLHLAASEEHCALIKLLLDKGADQSIRNCDGQTPLHVAAAEGRETVVRILLDNGADLSDPGEDGSTALHLAASQGHEAVASLLLEKGGDPSPLDDTGQTPLDLAIMKACVAVVLLLSEKGAGLSHISDTPLHRAAFLGSEVVVTFLLDKGADVSALDASAKTPLHLAAAAGHEAIARVLLDHGADLSIVDGEGYTILHHAVSGGHEKVAILLLERGVDPSVPDYKGITPLHIAVGQGYKTIIDLLLDKGVNISLPDLKGNTPLHNAVYSGREAVIRVLLDHGAEPSAVNEEGFTALHMAVYTGLEDVVSLILEKGGDPSAQDGMGSIPLHIAARLGYRAISTLLLNSDKSAYLDTPDHMGNTPLHLAASAGRIDMIRPLLNKGACLSATNFFEQTPLHLAAFEGHEEAVQILLDNGANPLVKDFSGETPLHAAAAIGCEEVVRLLLGRGANLSALNSTGETPLHLAASRAHDGVVMVLLEKGSEVDDSLVQLLQWTSM